MTPSISCGEGASHGKVEGDGFGVSQVEVAVGLWRKTGGDGSF